MSDPRPLAAHVTDESFADRLDDLADRFEAAWRDLAPPRIEAFLGEETGERRDLLRGELEEIDRAYRARLARAAGETAADAGVTPMPGRSEAVVSPGDFPAVPGYEILSEIGRGGMGVVYRARQTGLKREVALKMIRSGDRPWPRELARFRAEAEAVARLAHPNIVQVYEVGEHDGRPYLALEYVDGGSLAQCLAGAPLPVRPAAELVETLARAMHHAHQRGVLHRDLKPANVLLAEDRGQRTEDRGQRTEDRGQKAAQMGAPRLPVCPLSSVLCPLIEVLGPLPRSPTSAWPSSWRPTRARRAAARSWGRRATWRRSRRRPNPARSGRRWTCTRWGRSSMSC